MHLEVAESLPANTRFTFAELFERPGFAGVRNNGGVAPYTTTLLNPASFVTTGPTSSSRFSDFSVGGDSPDVAIGVPWGQMYRLESNGVGRDDAVFLVDRTLSVTG